MTTTRQNIKTAAAIIAAAALSLWLACADKGNPTTASGTTATPTAAYTLTTSRSPMAGGSVSRNPNKTAYDSGDSVTVTATPEPGYTFAGWTGVSTSSGPSIIIAMDTNKAITANFRRHDSSSTKDSTASVTPTDTTKPPKDSVATTTPKDTSKTKPTDSTATVTPNDTITKYYTLSTTAAPGGGGTISLSPDQTNYTAGTLVTATATPATNYAFSGWAGSSTSKTTAITFSMNENKTLTANFIPTYKLEMSVSPADSGIITISPNQERYDSGTVVTITASNKGNYRFSTWTGATTTTSNPITITMNNHKALAARFIFVPTYKITTTISPIDHGTITISPNQEEHDSGTVITITATPKGNDGFYGWSGALTSSNNTITITMNKNIILTANFGTVKTTFRQTVINGKTWMAENLSIPTNNSGCYNNDFANCDTYGRLYEWNAAKTACPPDWHLPTIQEWTDLIDYVGGPETGNNNLKTKTGWIYTSNDSTYKYSYDDPYNFSAVPGGRCSASNYCQNISFGSFWWTATESWGTIYILAGMGKTFIDDFAKDDRLAVRCVHN